METCETKMGTCSRLGLCEVCNDQDAKYTCPQCEVKTCSLPCSKIHKIELECSGIRNKVKYVPLKKFSDIDFQSDYMLLEKAGRDAEIFDRNARSLFPKRKEKERCNKLIWAAQSRKINLQLLPFKFSRHRKSSTYYNWKEKKIYWHIEWVFPEANGFTSTDSRIEETMLLSEALAKYVSIIKGEKHKSTLAMYQNAGIENCKILLKAEKVPGGKFFLMIPNNTFNENFRNKIIIEYPVFYVILSDSINKYNIVHLVNKKDATENRNLLMSVENDQFIESDKEDEKPED